jgi:predicted  nucleic acid-binding Zn-ribbon protein
MPERKPSAPEPLEDQPVKNTADLDAISLEQALLDVDVANARVIDLTKRLTALTKELRSTTTDLQKAKLRNRRLAAELEEIKGSRAFRSATNAQRVLGAVRARLGR